MMCCYDDARTGSSNLHAMLGWMNRLSMMREKQTHSCHVLMDYKSSNASDEEIVLILLFYAICRITLMRKESTGVIILPNIGFIKKVDGLQQETLE